ncbi:PEPxxWA-CTERM sorting domain-containing protein [Sphingomonas endophytica]|uniref:Ice-binding protein C-terminal domain-containing protein n=1 Tax=Sphingomonas endophytica TaxID=869719 RepID=A0A147I9C8_9SPHN|nr:PEPxxWA-CTERM sorting domain-containing protein [Sphingomonas endophytica]KTT75931.1 hypothetical protein NS334_01975 [Sphingomonas endophytica]
MKLMPVALAATLSIAAPAQAATIVDTGTPTQTYTGSALDSDQSLAGRFSLTSATMLTDIQGYIRSFRSSGILTIAINRGGNLPGSVLYSGTVAATQGTSFQGLSNLNWMLDAGDYWVSFANSGSGMMSRGAPNPLSVAAYWKPGQGWNSIYDPSRSIGVRISGVPAAVPEPATWAMMLLGFGMVGAAVRRRRPVVATVRVG